jgi:hypothetical protein
MSRHVYNAMYVCFGLIVMHGLYECVFILGIYPGQSDICLGWFSMCLVCPSFLKSVCNFLRVCYVHPWLPSLMFLCFLFFCCVFCFVFIFLSDMFVFCLVFSVSQRINDKKKNVFCNLQHAKLVKKDSGPPSFCPDFRTWGQAVFISWLDASTQGFHVEWVESWVDCMLW